MQEGELVYVTSSVSSREAKWFEQMGIKKSSDYFTVEFDSAGGNEIDTQSIKIGKKAKQPNAPTKSGYIFIGWYFLKQSGTEENPTYEEIAFDFSTEITKNYQLYAKYSGEAVMTAYKENQLFWKYKNDITSILFTSNSSLIPTNIKESWNIKADDNCADIIAYLENDTNALIIYSENTIYANASSYKYFYALSNLQNITFDNFDTSRVKTMNMLFYDCGKITNIDLSKFNTTNVTTMSRMFYNCSEATNIDVSKFETEHVLDMSKMFYNCSKVTNINITNFDTSNVTDMNNMFGQCLKLEVLNLNGFQTSKVTDMSAMFNNCKSIINIDVSNFNTSNVLDMSSMFYNCSKVSSLNLNGFDTSNVTSMKNMFLGCGSLLNIDASNFDTHNVTTMAWMFHNCRNAISINVNNFDTSNVVDMNNMFSYCSKLESLDLSSFDTSSVNNFNKMFFYAQKLGTIYSKNNKWVVQDSANITDMFTNCKTQQVTLK